MAAILESLELLRAFPIEFTFVGPIQMQLPRDVLRTPQAHWLGALPRADTGHCFSDADVFLFPTLSDGFGLTQLEAQAWKLPVITSGFCGTVVRDGVNGVLLPDISGGTIAETLRALLANPERLREMSRESGLARESELGWLGTRLLQVAS